MNIHLERYRQRINESAPMHLPTVAGLCEAIADRLGDKDLEDLASFLEEAESFQLIKFVRELNARVADEVRYRNQVIPEDEPQDPYEDYARTRG